MLDGSEKYTQMTHKAIESFQKTTPYVRTGLLVPPHLPSPDFLHRFIERLPDPERVETRLYQNHFHEWNPTQHKLDLVKFADRYETVVWLDSDVLVYKDMSKLLLDFHHSPKNFAFTQDHVTSNEEFRSRWPNSDRFLFIPQAAFMCFKSHKMPEFFSVWEDIWKEWITPYPFFRYADPYPSFHASAFCIEQYALGMAVERLLSGNFDQHVHVIPRSEILITDTSRSLTSLFMPSHLQSSSTDNNSTLHGGPLSYLLAIPSGGKYSIFGSSSLNLSSLGVLSSLGGLSSLNLAGLSSAGIFSSYNISGISSLQSFSSYNISGFSSAELAALSSFGLLSLSSYGSSGLSSLSQQELFRSLASTGDLSSFSLSILGSSSLSSSSGFGNFVIVDNFGDNVIHYYSANFDKIGV